MKVSDFKQALIGGGARANLFEVELAFPAFAGTQEETRIAKFLIKAAQIPASTLGVIEQPYRGRIMKLPGDRVFAEWSITVINDVDQRLRNAFERWSNAINSHTGNIAIASLEDSFVTASIFQLDRSGNRIKAYTFKDLWPSEVAQIEVSNDSTNQLQEFTVTLQYSEWVSDTTS